MKEPERDPVINFGSIERYCSYGEIEGKILFTMISEDETLFILTYYSFFYYQIKG